MANVASYKNPTTLETDKKTNLIYGLNGTGKSTISNFLYDRSNPDYGACSLACDPADEIIVYNQKFVSEFFHEDDRLKGVFTLSKENKDAETKINAQQELLKQLEIDKNKFSEGVDTVRTNIKKRYQEAELATWKIKKDYAGGDRVLEFCLMGLMGSKTTLFDHISKLPAPDSKPEYNIEILRSELELLKDGSGVFQLPFPLMSFSGVAVESDPIFDKIIVGNENSVVAEMIKRLGNTDWVREGIKYLPHEPDFSCPFCQKDTITEDVISHLTDYFDKSYLADIAYLKTAFSTYTEAVNLLPYPDELENSPFALEDRADYIATSQALKNRLQSNLDLIQSKIKIPSNVVALVETVELIKSLNEVIKKINTKVDSHNYLITNRDSAKSDIKNKFWDRLRWDYDQTIKGNGDFRLSEELKLPGLGKSLEEIGSKMETSNSIIREQQGKSVNIEAAINSINSSLQDLGIDSFEIVKSSETLYRVVRPGQKNGEYHTLSEGEKTIITFLYFVELCKGLSSADSVKGKRIVVIDDPISSLSHIFIFHVGRMIKNEFCLSRSFDQVFILTHSLYFFFEMTEIDKEKRAAAQNLFRVSKNANGSNLQAMGYSEIQNDYQAYWSVLKDPNQHPALLSNCMRNIIEYFFSFVRKQEFGTVFQMAALKPNKFQAFNRYMNRESHSLAQNLIDLKDFDHEVFMEGLKILFVELGYEEHYKAMMK